MKKQSTIFLFKKTTLFVQNENQQLNRFFSTNLSSNWLSIYLIKEKKVILPNNEIANGIKIFQIKKVPDNLGNELMTENELVKN